MSAALHCDVEVQRGSFDLRAAVSVEPGEIVGVIGANGSGKSTLLGAIAGTISVRSGHITLSDHDLTRRDAGRREFSLPRAARRVGLLDQRARLFPHLDALTNVAFGPRSQGVSHRLAAEQARGWLERVGLAGRETARESELSGGQQQRVALARTLAAEPEALLLDEPFAAIDVRSSGELRGLLAQEIRRLQIPTLLVTHDPIDLIALADRVIVLEHGTVAQRGTGAEILNAPVTDFAAEFSGRALIHGTVNERGFLAVQSAPVAEVAASEPLTEVAAAAVASFDPAAVRVDAVASGAVSSGAVSSRAGTAAPTDPGPENTLRWVGTVSALSSGRTGVRIECEEWPGFFAEVPVSRAADPTLQRGARVRLELDASAITLSAA